MKLYQLREDIQATYNKYLKSNIQKHYPDTPEEWLNKFIKGLLKAEENIKELNDNPDKILNRYIKNNLQELIEVPKSHIYDRILSDIKKVMDQRLPLEKKKELELKRIIPLIKKELNYDDSDAFKLASEIINNNMDIHDVINKMKEDSGEHKEYLDSSGKYKLYKITKWVTDGTEEKHLDAHELAPVHVDMKRTEWCVRFKDYFYNDDYYKGGPFYLIERLGKPFVLYFKNEVQYADSKYEGYFDEDLIKVLKGYEGLLNKVIGSGNLEMVKLVLAAGTKPDEDTLNIAIYSGNLEVVKLVLAAGAKPDGNTLSNAADSGNLEVVKLVLAAGAKPDGNTLHHAIMSGNLKMVKLVLDAGAKPSKHTLSAVTRSGNLEVVKLILDAGAKPDEHALSNAADSGNLEIVKLVLAAGAKPDENTLYHAIHSGSLEIVKLVLDAGAKPEENILPYVIRSGSLEIVKLVLDAGAKPDENTLYEATLEGNPEIIKLILDKGVKPNKEILDIAIWSDNPEIVKLIKSAFFRMARMASFEKKWADVSEPDE